VRVRARAHDQQSRLRQRPQREHCLAIGAAGGARSHKRDAASMQLATRCYLRREAGRIALAGKHGCAACDAQRLLILRPRRCSCSLSSALREA
jgi:hypothetical protein